jgi:hypothetical protein
MQTALIAHKVQEAVYAALTTDENLTVALSGIFDQPPTDAAFPYLAMGETNYSPQRTKSVDSGRINFSLIVWSDEQSQMETKELMAQIDTVLQAAELAVIGFDLLELRLQNASVMRQFNEQGSLYKGRLTYAITVYAKPSF